MPLGDADQTEVTELDAERYISPRDFLKIYGFHTVARTLIIGTVETDNPIPFTAAGGY